jgi:lauroyl/myristoyl acyltransferase
VNTGRAYALAWRVFVRLPEVVGRVVFDAVGQVAWALHGDGVRQLERNLARLRPDYSPRELRRLSRAGMRSYMRYFCQAFQMPGWAPSELDARVRLVGGEDLKADLAEGRTVVLAVAHTGNWDLAGAWAARNLGPLVTVVERLKPEELYQEFLAFREANGVTVVPYERGGVFRKLLVHARAGGRVMPIIADRDLSRGGADGFPTRIYFERLRGEARRAAGGPWGMVLDFDAALAAPGGTSRQADIAELTQAWVDSLSTSILEHPEDWHMLQKVFVADLDPERYAAATGGGGASGTATSVKEAGDG